MKRLVFSRKDGLNAYLCDGVFVAEGGNLVFSAEKTFDCGQCFRWEKLPDGSFVGVVKGRLLSLRENSSGFTVSDLCGALDTGFAEFLVSYFDLMSDYGSVTRELSGLDSVIEKAAEAGQGIRLLRQELFETVISFIISANNNIPRIKKCVARLSEMCGGKIAAFGGKDYFAFPEPGAITGFTDEEIQVTAGVGYRAPFIRQTAELFADGSYSFLKLLDAKCDGTLKKTVLALPGVGEKVAGCVTLFTGIDRSAFPVDVWVERMCEELYGLKGFTRPALQKRMEEYFGENGGLAQQYLFNYIRSIS